MLVGILTIVIVIGFHELGHFLAARFFGIGIQEFAIGIGPKLFAFRLGETRFSLRLLLLGGYVDPVDWNDVEAIPDDMEPIERRLIRDKKRWFSNQPLYERLIMIFMGPLFNVILAVVFLGVAGVGPTVDSWGDILAATVEHDARAEVIGLPQPHAERSTIFTGITSSFAAGGSYYLRHLAVISLWVAGFNLLPIPPLDGAGLFREVFFSGYLYGRTGKELAEGRRRAMSIWGVLALIGILVLIFFA